MAAGHRHELYEHVRADHRVRRRRPVGARCIDGDRPRLPRAARSPTPSCGPGSPPASPFGCKRTLVSSDYYPAPCSATTSIWSPTASSAITPDGIRTVDGVERPVDTIVLCTGFRAGDYLRGIDVVGRGGTSLHDRWAGAAPGVPRHGRARASPTSSCSTGRTPTRAATRSSSSSRRRPSSWRPPSGPCGRAGRPTVEVTPEAMARYAAELERDLAATVWTDGCRSYFHNASGDDRHPAAPHLRLVPRRHGVDRRSRLHVRGHGHDPDPRLAPSLRQQRRCRCAVAGRHTASIRVGSVDRWRGAGERGASERWRNHNDRSVRCAHMTTRSRFVVDGEWLMYCEDEKPRIRCSSGARTVSTTPVPGGCWASRSSSACTTSCGDASATRSPNTA